MTEIEAMPEGWEIVRLGAQSVAIQTKKILPHIYQTRMTRIGRISTDNFDPCASASSAQSVFYRNPAMIDDDKKPQMKAPRVTSLQSRASGGRIHVCPRRAYVGTKSRSVAFGAGVYTYACGHTWVRSREPAGFRHDERRYVHEAGFGKRIHRKERKAAQQEPLCSLCPLWLNVFFAPAHERAPPSPAVHPQSSRAGG